MIDLIKLHLQAGAGGQGRVAFRREKYVPKGGPAGGNGGDGGHIVIKGVNHLSSLTHLAGVKEINAEPGQPGGKDKKMGRRGENLVIEVPVGTRIWLLAENQISYKRHRRYGIEHLLSRDEIDQQKYYLEKEGQTPPALPSDEVVPILTEAAGEMIKKQARMLKKAINVTTDTLKGIDFKMLPKQHLMEITENGQEVILCQGGFGGRGNNTFKGPAKTTPLEAEYGTFGEEKIIVFEQLLLADVGLVGYPNAGKSTLISILTKARPKIGSYPFTTIEPNLGIFCHKGKEIVIADIPGLIEGASQGKGLGYAFLRHVEHTQLLLFVLALDESVIFDENFSNLDKANQLKDQLEKLEAELVSYGEEMLAKPRLYVINKIDLYDNQLQKELKKVFKKYQPLLISAATSEGLEALQDKLLV